MKKFVSIAIWTSIAAIVLWSMTAGTMDILGFKKCHGCGSMVRGKLNYRVIKDVYVYCNECLEAEKIVKQ